MINNQGCLTRKLAAQILRVFLEDNDKYLQYQVDGTVDELEGSMLTSGEKSTPTVLAVSFNIKSLLWKINYRYPTRGNR